MSEPAGQGPSTGSWLTLANAISLARLAATPFSLMAVLAGQWRLAAGIFVGAVISDFLDGIVARRRGTVSALGGVMDHSADAIYVSVTLWAVAYAEAQAGADAIPGILPLFIVLAFLQYLLDSRALAGQALRTSHLGRVNGIAYFVLTGTIIVRNALAIPASGDAFGAPPEVLAWLPDEAIYWAGLIVLVSTLVSMLDRLRMLIKTTPSPK